MRRKTVVIIATIIAVIFVLTTILSVVVPFIASAKTAQELKQELNDGQRERTKIKQDKSKISQEQKAALDRKKDAEEELEEHNAGVLLIQQEMGVLEKNIQSTEAEITQLSKQIDSNDELLKKRLRVMYEQGATTYLEVLIQSSGFSDMLTRAQLVQDLLDHDKKLLRELKQTRDEIASKKEQMQKKQNEKEEMHGLLLTEKQAAQTKVAEISALSKELSSKAEELERADQQLAEENRALEARIKAIEAEAAARAKASGSTPTTPYKSGGKLGYPLPARAIVTSDYGMRFDPIYKKNKVHTGIDLNAPTGTPILAAESGTVIISIRQNAYGNYVVINHGNGISTLYAHNSQLLVKEGDQVTKGQKIALSGSTGNSTGPHLHFEVRENGVAVNPRGYVNF